MSPKVGHEFTVCMPLAVAENRHAVTQPWGQEIIL